MFKVRYESVLFAVLFLVGLTSHISLLGTSSVQAASSHEVEHKAVLHISQGDRRNKSSRHVKIGLDKSMIVELPEAVSDVLVSNPKIVDAVVHTSRRVYLIGMKVGQANVFFFDKRGKKLAVLDMRVERDLKGLSKTLRRLIPNSDIKLETVGDNVVMTGSVENPSDASKASDLAKRIFKDNKSENVLNMLSVKAKEQVMLKVVVAEMNRKIAKNLGVNLNGVFNTTALGEVVNVGSILSNPALAGVGDVTGTEQMAGEVTFGSMTGGNQVKKTVRALEENGLIRTLAEPNLTALSGETAKFHAGGEFGYVVQVVTPTGIRYVVKFKNYGVQLNFTPVVLSEGRISLKIKSNVSEIDGFTLGVPSLTKRETETTVELPSGGTMAVSGMISEKTKENIDGLPGMMKLPILGSLFRSRSFQKEETELVILVTPYMVNHASRKEFQRADKGFATASDNKAYFLGQMNRVYGQGTKQPIRRRENVKSREVVDPRSLGFIVE